MDLLGDKWSMIIVRDLFNGKKTFGEFLDSNEKISTSVLTSRLELLKNSSIVDYRLSSEDKKVKLYYLTDKGIDLFPVICEMYFWSQRNFDTDLHPKFIRWSEIIEGMSMEEIVANEQKNYLKIRSKILK